MSANAGAAPSNKGRERTRRRFARRQWARRWLTWRYVLAIVVLVAAVASVVWLVFFSAVLSVRSVTVTGADILSEREVKRAAAVPEGEQLAVLDISAMRARVEALVAVKSADVARHWPDGVEISIVERQVVAVVDLGGRWRGMDADGVVFRDYERPPGGVPRVQVLATADRDALREAAQVISSLPADLSDRVDHVEVETVDKIALVLRDERRVEWGSAEESDEKASVLTALLQARQAKVYDVSVPGQPVTSDIAR
ncbi:FtsQ-type POTRA domain-containing protein [Nocardioides sp. InS609-2]|uniref:cell division protein FtsQ/DivIB n=1 Tax=Nocardioides sp. InS609-2 TaxID=2760705 RepID=UPI0020BF2C91|nr:FtsQ-type POTRA domain-containing protein [Nocardioides sp. InS609-2]